MQRKITNKQVVLVIAVLIILAELTLLFVHRDSIIDFITKYFWLTPIVLFKSFLKKFLLLNLFGVVKVLGILLWHATKLFGIKILKTIGVRYGSYFSSRKWQRTTQNLRIVTKRINRTHVQFKRFIASFGKIEYIVILIAYFPLFLTLFLFGISFRFLTKKTMASDADLQSSVTNQGIVGWLKQADIWVLTRIHKNTPKNK